MEASRALIPAKILTVGKDCVIGRIRPDGKPIQLIADYYAGKLSDIDKAIEMALIVQRTPYLISSGPEDRNRLLDYFRRVLNDEVILSINSADQNSLNVLNFNVQYILDKLEVEKTEVLHQALTEFGFDACGRDNERTLVAEVSLDSVETQDINDMYKQEIEYFAKDIKDILGLDIRFIPRTKEIKLLGDHINKSEEDAKKYDAGKDAE